MSNSQIVELKYELEQLTLRVDSLQEEVAQQKLVFKEISDYLKDRVEALERDCAYQSVNCQ